MRTAQVLLLSLVLGAGCTTQANTLGSDTAEAGWRTYAGASVSIDVPDDWDVAQDEKTGRLTLDGPDGEEAVVWTVFLPGATTARHPEALARALASRAWPDADLSRVRAVRHGRSVLLRRDDQDDEEITTALVGWTETTKGTAVVLYGVRAESDAYDPFAERARKAFATYRLTGERARADEAADRPAPPAAVRWARFVDPRERAFSVDVPQGWSVGGGVFRFGAVDVRLNVETRSPDGEILVRLGDPDIGTFVTAAIGYGEGSTFSPGYGQMMTVRRYVPPAMFAAEYASRRPQCRGFQPVSAQARPDLTREMNGIYTRFGLAIRLDAGDVSFTCGAWRGYWMAALQIVQMGGPAMWKPEYLLGYIASPAREAEARAVLTHLIGSVQVDPGWYQRQTGQAGRVSQVVSETGAAIERLQNDGYWARHRNDRARSIAQSNATLGIEQVEVPGTGDRYDVAAGSNYYWVSPQGTIVGTETDALPHIDFKALTLVRPGE